MADMEKDSVDSPLGALSKQYQTQAIEGQRALDAHRNKLMELMSSRKSMPFDPRLMVLAQGLLAPTKTGGFGESLGYGLKNLSEEAERQFSREQQEAKLAYDLEQQALQQKQSLLGQRIGMSLAGSLEGQPSPATSVELAPVAQAPEGGAPEAPKAAQPLPRRDELAALPSSTLLRLSNIPELKPQVDMIMKLREQARKEHVKIKVGDQEREIPNEEYIRYQQLAREGRWDDLRKWYTSFGLPFNYIKDEKVPGGLRPMTSQEAAGAQKKEESKFGEQKPIWVYELGRNLPMTGAKAAEYDEARSKGAGKVWLQDNFPELFPSKVSGKAPEAGGAPPSESEKAASTKTAELDAEAAAEVKKEVLARGRSSRDRILVAEQLDKFATDKSKAKVMAILEKATPESALGKMLSEGVSVGSFRVGLPQLREAVLQAGGTDQDVRNFQQLGNIYVQLMVQNGNIFKGVRYQTTSVPCKSV